MTHCLIIADAAGDRHELVSMLNAHGFTVEFAPSPEQALLACRRSRPDLIMLPDTMPSMSSVEFLHRLRRTGAGGDPAVLICASDANAASIGQAIWEGAAECLVQPFDADILNFKLRQVGFASSNVAA
ncbi:response regulator [Rhodoligotrophos ferricapiens]|uniref:response regulator n=1 Tax=Rhodoligotrophos ferricapiens TaxID=3069264 RepID=UPI00315DF339